MLSATVTILYGAFGTTLGIRVRRALSLFLPPFLVSLSVANYYLGEPKPFELCFASMVLMVFFQCLWMISTKVLETKVKTEMFQLAAYGAGDLLRS
jgi:dihydroceramidase